jgi:hypothetical protein
VLALLFDGQKEWVVAVDSITAVDEPVLLLEIDHSTKGGLNVSRVDCINDVAVDVLPGGSSERQV